MTFPNFLVVGAAKSGTDSLCGMLAQHPEIYVSSNKEPMFFVAEGRPEIPYRGPGDREVMQAHQMWISTRQQYESLFAGANGAKAIGEGSTWYLYDEDAPRRIHQHAPDMRLIAILRNPVQRAYSAFTMLLRDGRETTTDFIEALAAEDKRVRAGWEPIWHYRRMGFYHSQLVRYRRIFRPEQIRVVLQSDLESIPRETLRGLFEFLGVDDSFEPAASARMNVSLVPKNAVYHRLVAGQSRIKVVGKALLPVGVRRRIKRNLPESGLRQPPPMPKEAQAMLVEVFRDDILALQELLNRDLSSWLAVGRT